ncbi:hypothetical protein PIB30_011816 [Stylosanthes scabra]|uniref:RING-type E3 ubiquitin transferase n=1 Tax=Stylosanthes scabra TaxID=79078 RepID=A0ABU6S5H5_9FABA|nr:hypothetical protein [Stylosanthes scabra]
MNTVSQIFQNIFSDNSNIMLAAIISLLLVILFVLLLHLYAKWFLAQAQAQAQANARRRRRRRRRAATVTVSDVLGPARFHHFHSFNIEDSPIFPSSSSSSTHHNTSKGLDSSIIAGIPLFIYTTNNEKVLEHDDEEELECVICLSSFIDGEMGRCLPKCGHGFHVECIDMWLSSHSNCPICRAPIILSSSGIVVENNDNSQLGSVIDDGTDHDHDHVDDGGASAFVEIVVDDFGQSSEIRENHENGGRVSSSSDSSVSESETSTSLVIVGCSLKRMLSKVFPSSNVNVHELQT